MVSRGLQRMLLGKSVQNAHLSSKNSAFTRYLRRLFWLGSALVQVFERGW